MKEKNRNYKSLIRAIALTMTVIVSLCFMANAAPVFAAAGDKLWEFPFAISPAYPTTPAFWEDKIIVTVNYSVYGGYDGKIYCLDAKTGIKQWEYYVDKTNAVISSPLISDNKVFVGTNLGAYCFDISTGIKLWENKSGQQRKVLAISNGTLYGQGSCLDAKTGVRLWRNTNIGESTAAISGDKVFFAGINGTLYCLNATTGEEIWRYETGGWSYNSPSIDGNYIYFNSGGKLCCLDIQSKNKIWEFQLNSGRYYSPTLIDNGRVYVGSELDKKFYCLDAKTGIKQWEYNVSAPTSSTLTITASITNGKVLVGSVKALSCLDALTGSKIWEYNQAYYIASQPIISDGKAYIIDSLGTNKLHCLDMGDPSATGWNMYGHDLQHTGNTANSKIKYLKTIIRATPTLEFSQYKLKLIEVYQDNEYPVESGVQFTVSDPTVATINDNILTANKNGFVTISTDYNGSHFERKLFVVTSPDYWESFDNNSTAKAENFLPDKVWKGDMVSGTSSDTDYYKFTISGYSRIQFGYLAEIPFSDTKIELLNASNALVIPAIYPADREKIFSLGLDTGTYYLKISSVGTVEQDSSYYLAYTVLPNTDTTKTFNMTVVGTGGYKETKIYSLSDTVDFNFALTQKKNTNIRFTNSNPSGIRYSLFLLDSQKRLIKELATDQYFYWYAFMINLEPGNYTLRVKPYCYLDTDAYPFGVLISESADIYENEINDTYQTATNLSMNVPVKGVMYYTDVDYYSFSLAAPDFIKINLNSDNNGADYKLTLYKDSEQNVVDSTLCQNAASAFIETGLSPGSYVLKIETSAKRNANPFYTLTLSKSQNALLEIESNNTPAFANPIDNGHPRQGRIYSTSDADYYGFRMTQDGLATFSFRSDSTTADYKVGILDSAGVMAYQKTSLNGAAISLEKNLPAGDYYLKVESGGDIAPNSFYYLSTAETGISGIRKLVGISLSASEDYLAINESMPVTISAHYTDATQETVSGDSWTSSAIWLATVNQIGLVTGKSDGYVTIYAAYKDKAAQISFRIGSGQKVYEQSYGNLILLAGGGNDPADPMRTSIQYLSDLVYQRFQQRFFKNSDIYYFNPVAFHDIDGDGYDNNIVKDTSPTVAEFGWTITEWAKSQNTDGPLYLYLIDHGGTDSFRISATEILTASQLRGFADTFQNTTGRRVVIIIEACKSGTFTDNLVTSGQNRVVITSTGDQDGYMQVGGSISFTQFFTDRLLRGDSLYNGWVNTKNNLAAMGTPYSNMQPRLAEGISSVSGQVVVGGMIVIAPDAPTFSLRSSDTSVPINTSVTLFADVTDANGIESVWVVITPPDYVPPLVSPDFQTPETGLPTVSLTDSNRDGRYEAVYSNFKVAGSYRFTFWAKSKSGYLSYSPVTIITVTGTGAGIPGDINGDGAVDLKDAIIVLRVLAGINTTELRPNYAASGADVNGNGKVGMEELVYILQKVAGLR